MQVRFLTALLPRQEFTMALNGRLNILECDTHVISTVTGTAGHQV